MIFMLFIKDQRGNGILLFALMLLIIISTVLIVEVDYAKVLITKVSMSMVADIAASEAAKELDMDRASNRGETVLDNIRARETAKNYIIENRTFVPGSLVFWHIEVKDKGVEVDLASNMRLSQYNRKVVVKARGYAQIRNLK